MIHLEPSACEAIRAFLVERGLQGPLRIDLQSSGCCDASLGLSVDEAREGDLIQEVDELTFVIRPETYRLVGEVRISYVDEIGRKGFVLKASRPLSEWDTFGISTIRI
jgi:Fe-S cluster assembly iron-binding protein IscA